MSNRQDIHPQIYNQLVNQFNQLKMNYSKLLNIRVDFHYGLNQPCKINKAYQDMVYLYHMFKLAYNGVIGCQFVLEHSTTKSLHIHAIFFINGQQHQKYYLFYLWLNNFWFRITDNFGHTVDCNNSSQYKHSVVGDVKAYQDDDYDRGMLYLIRYFAKQDQKEIIPDFYRCFTSKVIVKTNRGRPRTSNLSLLSTYSV